MSLEVSAAVLFIHSIVGLPAPGHPSSEGQKYLSMSIDSLGWAFSTYRISQ